MTNEELENLMKKVEAQNTERMMSQMDSVLWSQVTANRLECLKIAVSLQTRIGYVVGNKYISESEDLLQLADKLYGWINKREKEK